MRTHPMKKYVPHSVFGNGLAVLLAGMVLVSAASLRDVQAEETKQEETAASEDLPDLKTLDGHFPFAVPESLEQWESRAEQLRTRVAMATGLHPMLPRPAIQATIHSVVKREGFQVEKVYFESLPGHFVTGLLFRPAGENVSRGLNADGKRPAVLCPHGHGGRMMRNDADRMKSLIANGDELYMESGSLPKLARCATLARMGCVSFIFDMVGYADSVQLSHALAHRRHETRDEEFVPAGSDPELFFSTSADARLQSILGLQTYNALRSFDFLASLEDVDPSRLAVTGGSGGGTQTILLDALEPRIMASFPNGMVSTSMQGGCACENACLLRIGTGNVELAALMAPKPMGMTAADDWTIKMMSDGYPELKQLYSMMNQPENVLCESLVHFKHNYNYVTRRIMYGWMNEHLGLGLETPIVETDYPAITDEEGAVWDDKHPAPTQRGPQHEKSILSWWDQQNERLLADCLGQSATASGFDETIRPALATLFDLPLPEASGVAVKFSEPVQHQSGATVVSGVVVDRDRRREIPIRKWIAKSAEETALPGTVLWVQSTGKGAAGEPEWSDALAKQLQQSKTVIVIDIASMTTDAEAGKQRTNPQPRRASAAFTYGYNRPLPATRCGDVLAVIAAFQNSPGGVTLVAPQGAAAYALPAAAIAGPFLTSAVIDVNGFRFADLRHQDDESFVPGIVKYGDVDALAAWRAPYALTIRDSSGEAWATTKAIYQARDASDQIQTLERE
ncbi:acetylxylan esterase [Rhodopirellula sp. P2]|uniref:acetylxylan esterase n=1 Tax=Rhodopirellula sp. P2 TaxID=2127060 RepID=UPI0023684941|nr:acetylxylan esterase [Rhodopirellula sp. P2]WDQ16876.1 acetylxylan esterase [Rhodopirellula sp. P2]